MKRAELSDVLRYDGELYEVIAINEGYRSLTLRPVKGTECPACGDHGHLHLIEQSRLFQDSAEPVPTISETPKP